MNTLEYTMLLVSTVSMGLVVLVFGFGAPWYRTWAGWCILGTKLALFIILLILAYNEKHNEATDVFQLLMIIVYPLTTLASLGMLWLMVSTQLSHHRDKTAELLYRKHVNPSPTWDGTERRHSHPYDTEENK